MKKYSERLVTKFMTTRFEKINFLILPFLITVLILLRFSSPHYQTNSFTISDISHLTSGFSLLEEDDQNRSFRWTNGNASIPFPRSYSGGVVQLQMYVPNTVGTTATLGLNQYSVQLKSAPDTRVYRMFLPPEGSTHAPLFLNWQSRTFRPSNDDRTLGMAVFDVKWHHFDRVVVISRTEWIIILAIILAGFFWLLRKWRLLTRVIIESIQAAFVVDHVDPRPFFRLAVLLSLLVQMPLYNGLAGPNSRQINVFYFAALCLIFLAIAVRGRFTSILLLISVVVIGVEMRVYWTNQPTTSDVYWANMQAVQLFLEGRNPYAEIFTWVSIHPRYAWYGYLPFTIISQLPFFLLGDVRWGLAVYDLATIGLIYLMVRRYLGGDKAAAIAGFLLIYVPLSAFTFTDGIVDPIMMFWLTLSFYLLTHKHWAWAAVTAGLAVASKQYAVVYAIALLPYLIKQRQWRAIILLIIIPCAWILPYFIWSPTDFIRDTVQIHLNFPTVPQTFPGIWNTSLPGQWVGLINKDAAYGNVVLKPIARIVTIICVVLVVGRNLLKPTLRRVIGTTTVLLCILFIWNGSLTQYFYWRDVVLLMGMWLCFWLPNATNTHLSVVEPVSL